MEGLNIVMTRGETPGARTHKIPTLSKVEGLTRLLRQLTDSAGK
jgi:hypothetical protein